MAEEKNKQWLIDRAYNMNESNIGRTKQLLSCIDSIEKGECSVDDGLQMAVDKGLITSVERYGRSTATGLKSYGLLSATYNLTEIAKEFINDRISFKDMMILQLIKKEDYNYKQDTIRPFFILFKVLLRLLEKEKSNCWIDCYDYQEFLTEIDNNSEINETVDKILLARKKGQRIPKYKINHFDIWTSAFISTGLLKETDDSSNERLYKKYTLVDGEIAFIKELVANENKLDNIYEKYFSEGRQKCLEQYGKRNNGVFKMMPQIHLNQSYEVNYLQVDLREIVSLYLFDGESFRTIDSYVLGDNVADATNGWFSHGIMKALGIPAEYKGIWFNYKNHKNLIKLNEDYKKLGNIYNILFDEEKHVKMEKVGFNKIYYGIPGCGKSHHIEHVVLNGIDKDNVIRTTFYLDYSNSDFIGQIYPKVVNRNVEYVHVPGPFTRALAKAYSNPSEMVYLVIEEINRGNAAAIFGDTFQLLDRLKKDYDGRYVGDSEYPISNTFIEDYFELQGIQYTKGQIYIPRNLTILATMNTSDQNVFPLDTAFKRRWDRERVPGDWNKCTFKDKFIPYTDTTWGKFATSMNVTMVSKGKEFAITEDKQMGPWFANESMLTDSANEPNNEKLLKFVNNVIDYLFNDVTKFEHTVLFDNGIESFEDIDKFITKVKDPEEAKKFIELFTKDLEL